MLKLFDNQDKSITYTYQKKEQSKKLGFRVLDHIIIEVIHTPNEMKKTFDYSKIEGEDKENFVFDYTIAFFQAIMELLAEGFTVVLSKHIIGLSLHTTRKNRVFYIERVFYKSLRVYVHVSRKFNLKARTFYYSHWDRRFIKNIGDFRRASDYTRYPSNFL